MDDSMDVLYSEVNKKGEKFELRGEIQPLKVWLQQYLGFNEEPEDLAAAKSDDADHHEYHEYSIYHCDNARQGEAREWGEVDIEQMKVDREQDLQDIRDLLAKLESGDPAIFAEWLTNCAKKKNGTLHKGRIQTLLSLGTFTQYWVDSYGWFGPMVKIRNIDDYTAELEWSGSDCVAKY